jgi:hypothetical protein
MDTFSFYYISRVRREEEIIPEFSLASSSSQADFLGAAAIKSWAVIVSPMQSGHRHDELREHTTADIFCFEMKDSQRTSISNILR